MKIDVKGKRTNKLLAREEVEVTVKDIEKTPSRLELKKEIAHKLNAPEECIVIGRISQHFGFKGAECIAYVYESREKLQKTELQHRIDKSFGVKRSKAAQQAASSAKAEEIKEEKKEVEKKHGEKPAETGN